MKKLSLILLAAIVCVACAKKADKAENTPVEEVAVEDVVVEEVVAEEVSVVEETIVENAVEEQVAVEETAVEEEIVEEEPIVMSYMVDVKPEFVGGYDELVKYLSSNLKYPAQAKENNWEGNIVCQFIVEKDGSISNVTIVRSSKYQVLDDEAIRVISNMPNWNVGKKDGENVRVQMALPIQFKL